MAKNDDWLTVLEEKVEDAIAELESRRKRNAELEARLAEVESKGEDEADWEKERAEVRKRVEVLAEKLESLL